MQHYDEGITHLRLIEKPLCHDVESASGYDQARHDRLNSFDIDFLASHTLSGVTLHLTVIIDMHTINLSLVFAMLYPIQAVMLLTLFPDIA